MIRLISIYIILISCFSVVAQQDPLISHIFFNKLYKNPAFAGQQGEVCANIISRQQWVGFDGAPQTTLLSVDAPIKLFGLNSGIGLQLSNEKLGNAKSFIGSLQYAYIKDLSTGTLSFGLQLGLYNQAYEGIFTGTDNVDTDISIPQEKDQGMTYDLGFGIVYTLNDFYAGLSVAHLTQPKFKLSTREIPYIQRHYYLMSGYKFSLQSSPIEISPNLIVQYDGASAQIITNINLLYNKKFWGGVTYKIPDALDVNIGIELFNGIKIGYAYGLNLSKLVKTNSGSHEVMIGYCFNLGMNKVPQKYRSVRFL